MNDINISELNELYMDTLLSCNSDILKKSEVDVEYDILENFAIGAVSFLHKDSLNRLWKEGYIDEDIFILSSQLRQSFFDIEDELQSIKHLKQSTSLIKLLKIGDKVLAAKKVFDSKT